MTRWSDLTLVQRREFKARIASAAKLRQEAVDDDLASLLAEIETYSSHQFALIESSSREVPGHEPNR